MKPSSSNLSGVRPAVIAGYLAWLLDSFDFFLVVFCLSAIGASFHRPDADIALSITLTLAFRPLGALVFGILSDRYGRRLPLMIIVAFYSIVEILTAFSPNFITFMIMRALFGIGFGGEWGISASFVMEKASPRRRGLVSGFLQQGYAAGNIVAAICYFFLFQKWGWRPLFVIGGLPSLLILFIRYRVKESEVWESTKHESYKDMGRTLILNWKLFCYIVIFIAVMTFAGHGTVDMYPTFLQRQWHVGPAQRSLITGLSMVSAVIGGLIIGYISDLWGRRRAIIAALALGALTIPVWAYSPSLMLLISGACVIQFFVQGAWGVVPAYLTELSPDSVRGSLTGFAYQCGSLIGGLVVYVEALLAQSMSYSTAMAATAAVSFVLALIGTAVGREYRGRVFGRVFPSS